MLLTGIVLTSLLSSCEQEYFEPNTTALPGGGTVSTYKAYTISSFNPDGDNVYGRVVFYRYSATVTLVQMGLYNTDPSETYSAEIYSGPISAGSTTVVKGLDGIDGESGAFVSSKYVVIKDATFFDNLDAFDASVKVLLGTSAVAGGDIGANEDPVAEQD